MRPVRRVAPDTGEIRKSFETKNVALALAAESIAARAQLEKQGLVLSTKPLGEMPTLPDHLANQTDDDLMDGMTEFTRWADFLGGQLALAEVDERSAEAVYDKARALAILRNKPTGREDSVTVAKAEADTDADVVKYHGEFLQRHARRKLVSVMYNNADRGAALFSRELTRRVGREPKERRADRWKP